MQLTSALLLLGGVCLLIVALAAWMKRKERESLQYVVLNNGLIVLSFKGKVEKLPICDIREIRYSWVAAVFFAAFWEFDAKSGATLKIDSSAVGLDELLSQLELLLSSFSVAEVKRAASEGDVHGETICAWKATA